MARPTKNKQVVEEAPVVVLPPTPTIQPSKIQVQAVSHNLFHPFQQVWIDTVVPTEIELDGWLRCQIEAKKIITITEE